MADTYTSTANKALIKPDNNSYSGHWNVPVNADWDIIDTAFGGTYTVSLTNANVTLTQANTQNACIKLTGTLTGNVTIYFPASVSGYYLVNNATTGSFTVTLAYTGGAGPTLATRQGVFNFVWVDASAGGVYAASNAQIVAGSGISVTGNTVSVNWPLSTTYGGTGTSTYTNGQLLIGNSASGSLVPATLTAGSGVSITNGNGSITIASTTTSFDPAVSYFWTGQQQFYGSNSNIGASFRNFATSANAYPGVIGSSFSLDVIDTTLDWKTSSPSTSSNFSIAFTGNGGANLSNYIFFGQSVTCSLLYSNGTNSYGPTSFVIDSINVTPLWEGGTMPTPYANALNLYTFTILRTGTSTWSILASLKKYA
jgi:hypothetical protein